MSVLEQERYGFLVERESHRAEHVRRHCEDCDLLKKCYSCILHALPAISGVWRTEWIVYLVDQKYRRSF